MKNKNMIWALLLVGFIVVSWYIIVVVANIVPNKDSHDVSVTATADTQLIYNDAPILLIEGSGFNPQGTTLGFSNFIKEGINFNYSVSSITDTTISLR